LVLRRTIAGLRDAFDRLAAWAGTRRGLVVLFALSLAVYELEGLAAPLGPGRDLGTYLHYYLQIGDGRPPLMFSMLYREPLAPLVLGASLDWGGRPLAEGCMAVLYAGSVVAWSSVAGVFGSRSRLFMAIALLIYPGYGLLFHEFSSDAVFAAAFAGWALLVSRAMVGPSAGRFALVGLGVGLLTLVRPGNEALLVFALLPLFVVRSWRQRALDCVAFLVGAGLLLGSWTGYNGVRYGDYAISRGGNAYVPFFRAFVADHIVSPTNGSASRHLAQAVQRYLLPEQPYRAYGITLHDFFAKASIRMHEDLIVLSDRVWGWNSNYSTLQNAGLEAVEAHPLTYAHGVAKTVWDELWYPLFSNVSTSTARASPSTQHGRSSSTVEINGRTLPRPTEGEPIPASHYTNNTTTPAGHIHDVWTSPTAHHLVYANPRDQRRYEQLLADTARLEAPLVGHSANATLKLRLDQSSKWYPRLLIWLIVGLIALVIRRPRNAGLALALILAALTVIAFTALAIFAAIQFSIPVAPAFLLLAAAGLLGDRRWFTESRS
jgi:hypothetical protein